MTSKERILTAVKGGIPDRIPCSFHGTGIVVDRLKKHLGLSSYRQVLDHLASDMIDIRGFVDPLWRGPKAQVKDLGEGVKENYLGFRTKGIQTEHGVIEEHCDFIFKNCKTPDEMDRLFNWPEVDWFDFSTIKERLAEYSDLAIIASGASIYQHPTLVRGVDNFLVDMMVNEEFATVLMDKYMNFYLAYFERMFSQTGRMIDVLRIADDLGMQDRLLVSPQMFRKYFKPRIQKIVDMAHSFDVKVMFHSCGSIAEFIEDLIEIGVDILDPIQTRAKGMDPEIIKSAFGSRICLHGSIDTQYTLPKGTTKEVENEVKNRIEQLGPGGFILAPSHVVQPDVPIENILVLYKVVKERGLV